MSLRRRIFFTGDIGTTCSREFWRLEVDYGEEMVEAMYGI